MGWQPGERLCARGAVLIPSSLQMLDNLALLFVHGALAILLLRLIRTPDPDEVEKPRPKPTDRFKHRRPGVDG